jgi:signal transduction histidine kinase
MSIRTKLRVGAGVTIGFALIVALTVFVASRNLEQASAQDRFAERVIKDVSDLNSLSYAYLLFKEKRPKAQWQIKYASLGKALSEHKAVSVAGKDLLARLSSNHERMKQLFEVASEGVNGGRRGSAKKASPPYDELKEGVTAQLLASAEVMSNDASLLGRESEQLGENARKTSFILVLASAFILIVSATATASLLAKSIGGSIRRLKQGTQRIASGDLSYRLRIQTKDELGDLAQSFDHMTEQLQVATVARDLLQQEVVERKRAEEALNVARDTLEFRVEERTRELQQAYDKLKEETEERGRLEERLRQSQKMEAIGTLAGGIAHDFNNILAAILGFTEMAVEDVAGRPEVEENLKKVLQSAMRARDLVKQILAFSRKTNYARDPISLSPLIRETVQLLRASIPATIEIKLTMDTSWDRINAAPVEVQQILMNLATNAALAMQEQGGTLEISLTDIDFSPDSPALERDVMPGEYLMLTVKDTGIGMGPEVMKRVFEPFFTTREAGKGSGMGLAVVYGIVKDLQGTIAVESRPGVGSIFRVLLPKVDAEIEKEQARPAYLPKGTERILFVDDEEMLREWGETALSRLGYTVTTMADSAEALKVFCSDPTGFDLVITDQTMPSMTGIQFAKELLKVRPDMPVILCTGHSETISPDIAKDAGIREYLMKPLARQELAATVRQVLDG